MKRIIWIIGFLISIYSLSFTCTAAGDAADDATSKQREEVRVGYCQLGDYYTLQADGTIDSYDVQYLNKIEEYTGLTFTYVDCGNWNNALRMLQNHEVDLLGTMQWSQEREDTYEICDAYYCTTFASIVALSDRGYIYEDYEAIEQAKIGCTSNYIREEEFMTLLADHHISPEIVYYETTVDLEKALESGEVDMIAANSHTLRSEWNIVEKYAYSPYYFASYKENEELTEKISEAILHIELYESDFKPQLMSKFFPTLINSPFTKEELEFIGDKTPITLYFDGNISPLAYLDKDTGEMTGILIDTCKMLSESTGLEFQYELIESDDQSYGDREFTLHFITGEQNETKNGDEILTNSIFECSSAIYGKSGVSYDLSVGKPYRVAIPINRPGFIEYFKEEYPDLTIVQCKSPQECVSQLENDQVDLIFLNTFVADNYLIEQNIKNIVSIPTTDIDFSITLGIHGEGAEIIRSVINKGVQMLDETERQNLVISYAVNTTPKATLNYFIQTNTTMSMVILFALFLVVLVIIVWLVRYRVLKRQKELLAAANKELERASAAKTDFLSRMSHDIRTPMNAIIGMSGLGMDESTEKQSRDYFEKIGSSGHYLLGIINDILDMSRIESGYIELHEEIIEVKELRDRIVQTIQPLLDERKIKLKCDFSAAEVIYIYCDRLRTRQVYMNLLSNAIKFSEPGSTVEWIFREIKEENGRVYYEQIVRDHGCGISKEFLAKMFQPFEQEQNTYSRESSGTGLGLAICRNLVEQMGGTITVKSELGRGSEFTIRISHQIAETYPPAAHDEVKKTEVSVLAGKQILLCEDHPLNTEIAVKLLEKKGMIVTCAVNGQEAVDTFVKSPVHFYDAVLMDISMPVMDGLEATRAIRALDRVDARRVPIIAMTANAYETDRENSYNAGMNAHLAKPIEPQLLFQTLLEFI